MEPFSYASSGDAYEDPEIHLHGSTPMLVRLYGRALGILRTEAKTTALAAFSTTILGILALLDPILFGRVIGSFAESGGQTWTYIAAWSALSVVSAAAGVAASVLADRLSHRRRLAAMTEAFDSAITLPIARVSAHGTGRLVQAISAGGDALFTLILSGLREQLPALVSLLLLIPVAFAMNTVMASVLVALALVYITANVIVIRNTETGQRAVNEQAQEVFGRMGDVVANVSVVQAYAMLRAETAKIEELTRGLLRAQYPVLNWWGLLVVLTRSASTLALVSIFAVGAVLAHKGQASLADIVSFGGFAGLLISKLDLLSTSTARIVAGAPVLDVFFNLLRERGGPPESPAAVPLEHARGEVAFEGVTHHIAGHAGLGVFDVDFRAPAGRTIALVGPSGAGKTTLMALLQRLRDPDQGRILIDGRDIRTLTLESLRRSMAVVFQDAGLFNRSIADNLRLARPDATEAQMEAALRAAEAWDFVEGKEGGLSFVVGERGQFLSGGERQRLAIARAILKDAPILILDEATSALDPVTERKVKTALDRASHGRTTFVIAHRLSTIVDADWILVLDKGRVVEQGEFQTLIRQGGRFARMAEESGLTGQVVQLPRVA